MSTLENFQTDLLDNEAMKKRLKDTHHMIEEVCKITGQVGLSYGVLYKGEVVVARGYGYRNVETQSLADEHTLYNIASLTKAFTATACTLLAKDGLVDFNTPVKKYLPEFKEEEATLEDLLAHRTGYARLDMSWIGKNSEVLLRHSDLIARINELPRIHPLRSKWLYNNWMYALAGVIVGRQSKEGNYLQFMKQRVLEAFGLKRSCIEREAVVDDNISLAYAASRSGAPIQISEPPWEESPFTPGGGIRSCVSDMLIWAQCLIQAYERETRKDVPDIASTEKEHPGTIFAPKMMLPDSISHDQLERSYGMGFMRLMLPSTLSYGTRNESVASDVTMPDVGASGMHTLALAHSGQNAGVVSAFTILPELDAAIVVLGNTTALGDANELVMHLLVNQILNPDSGVDYSMLATQIAERCKTWHDRVIRDPLIKNRVHGTSHGPLGDYVGCYVGFGYTMRVELEDGQLVLYHAGRESQRTLLDHYHYDSFSFATSDFDEHMRLGLIDYFDWRLFIVQFERDYTGAVVGIKWFLDTQIRPALLDRQTKAGEDMGI